MPKSYPIPLPNYQNAPPHLGRYQGQRKALTFLKHKPPKWFPWYAWNDEINAGSQFEGIPLVPVFSD